MEGRTLTQEFEVDMAAYFFRLTITAESHIEDGGIGAYEFWGTKGYDSQPYETLEDAELEIEELEVYNFDGDAIAYDDRKMGHLLDQWMDDKFDTIQETLITYN